jgi:radical SAM superfamily enzyme YgiQ (UPF0313 family)
MKILIVNPPRTHPPFFTLRDEICFQDVKYVPFPMRLAMAAALARQAGHEIRVIDANAERFSWEDLENKLVLEDFEILVTQSAAGILKHDMRLCSLAKKLKGPTIDTLMIESVVSPIFPERVMRDFPDCDLLLRGQLERVLPDLLLNWETRDRVKGLVFREKETVRITKTALPLSQEELNELPFMAYDLFPMSRYSIAYLDAPLHERVLPGIRLRTTRDCPFKCPFCIIGSVPERGYDARLRALSARRAVDEIEHVVKTYALKAFFFWDETFTYNKKRCREFLQEIIDRNLDIQWRCLTRVDCLDDELIDLMARSGCQMIEFGIESGDPEGRQSHHKGFSNEKAIEVVEKVRRAGIRVNCDMIVGMPWDTKESIKKTEALACAMKADGLHLTIAFPYPGTELYDTALKENLLQVEDIYETMIHKRVRVDLKPTLRTRTLSAEEVLSAWKTTRTNINKVYMRHNIFLRPWAFWPVLRHAEGPGHLLRMIPKALKLMTGRLI